MVKRKPALPVPAAAASGVADSLREHAEERLRAAPAAAIDRPALAAESLMDELLAERTGRELQHEELRHAQIELAHELDRYSDPYDFAPVGCLILDDAGVIERANLHASTLLGVERGKLVGARLARFVARSSQNAFVLHWRRVLATDGQQSVELALRPDAAGRSLLVELRNSVRITSPDGRSCWHAALLDITARKHAVRELRGANFQLERRVIERTAALHRTMIAARASQALLAGIVGTAMDAIVSFDAERRVILFNAAAERMFGWPAAQIIGQPFDRLFPPGARLRQARPGRTGTPNGRRPAGLPRPLSALRADGTTFPVEASISRQTITGQKISTVILRDNSSRQRALDALVASETALADFFITAPLGLMWVLPDGSVERINLALLEIMGCAGQSVIGLPAAGLFTEPEIIANIIARVAQHETVRNQRVRLLRKDGSTAHLLIDANAHWQGDRLVHSSWFVRDITNRLALEREILAIAEREQLRIGQDLHDDLCQQLAAIEFASETAAGACESKAPALVPALREISAALRGAMDHARELARGLAAPLSPQSGGLIAALQHLAKRTTKVFRCKCRFRSRVPMPFTSLDADIHLFRIAQEAISNAIRHGKARRIEIELTLLDRELVLGVKDDGVGLPANRTAGRGMGLRIMQYRAGIIAGSLVVQRRPRGGTAVVCTIKNCVSAPPPCMP